MTFVSKYYRLWLSIWIAFVFVQSLFFKFTGSSETQYIFAVLGEWLGMSWFAYYGAYIVGTMELIAAIALFTRWQAWAALLAFEIMSGAIVFHLFTPLGIVMPAFSVSGEMVGNDGGALFFMACITWASATGLVVADVLSPHSRLRFKHKGQ
ncbi:hypothetical protein [Teredinibacter franksiae]|uniref:hypothetical protein n=1 Tax=Teredinibacter franksiae TaxID=2761453 RepID=UPI00162AB95E|nr:hypothetical protein [Teredinibacter franksiae]